MSADNNSPVMRARKGAYAIWRLMREKQTDALSFDLIKDGQACRLHVRLEGGGGTAPAITNSLNTLPEAPPDWLVKLAALVVALHREKTGTSAT